MLECISSVAIGPRYDVLAIAPTDLVLCSR